MVSNVFAVEVDAGVSRRADARRVDFCDKHRNEGGLGMRPRAKLSGGECWTRPCSQHARPLDCPSRPTHRPHSYACHGNPAAGRPCGEWLLWTGWV